MEQPESSEALRDPASCGGVSGDCTTAHSLGEARTEMNQGGPGGLGENSDHREVGGMQVAVGEE